MPKFNRRLLPGDRVHVSGDTAELWIEDYNVRVDTDATVLVSPDTYAKKILLSLDSIDGDSNVAAYVRISKLRPAAGTKATWDVKDALNCVAGRHICRYPAMECPFYDEDLHKCDTQKIAQDALDYIYGLEQRIQRT